MNQVGQYMESKNRVRSVDIGRRLMKVPGRGTKNALNLSLPSLDKIEFPYSRSVATYKVNEGGSARTLQPGIVLCSEESIFESKSNNSIKGLD